MYCDDLGLLDRELSYFNLRHINILLLLSYLVSEMHVHMDSLLSDNNVFLRPSAVNLL